LRFRLSIVAGPAAGQKILVLPGQKVRVGRIAPSEHTIADDDYLSGVHFVVSNLGDRCLIEDLKSRNGLFVNGKRVQQIELGPFDAIAAGLSKFVVNFMDEAVVGTAQPGLPLTNNSTTANLANARDSLPDMVATVFRGETGNLFCVVDSAQDDAILDLLRQSRSQYQILYEGVSAEDLVNFGPYLVELPDPSELLHTIVEQGWGKNWGIFLKTQQPFQEVREHLRRFLMVDLPSGKRAYFRFYDPRVMRQVLTEFNLGEAKQFFGPIDNYFCEAAERKEMLKLQVGDIGVESSVIRVRL